MPSVFTWFSLSWPKTNYLKGPCVFSRGVGGETWKTQNRDCCQSTEKDWRGYNCQNRLRPPLLLHQCLLLTPHNEGGSSSPPGLWFCGNLVQSLFVLSLLKSIWSALWNYLCNSYGGYCAMRWYLLCIYCCVETLWFFILGDTYDTCNELSMHNVLSTMSWDAWHHQV
jgi:hypothetical protein